MPKKCSIPTKKQDGHNVENIAYILSNNFESTLKSVKETSKAGDTMVAKATHDFIYNKYKDTPDYPDNVISNAFLKWLEDTNKGVHANVLSLPSNRDTEADIKKVNDKALKVLWKEASYLGALSEYSETSQGGETNRESNAGGGSSNYREAGLDFLNSVFFRGLDIRMLESDYAKLASYARDHSFKETLREITKRFGKDFPKTIYIDKSDSQIDQLSGAERYFTLQLKSNLAEWHNANLKTNRRMRHEIEEYVLQDWIEVEKKDPITGKKVTVLQKIGSENDFNGKGSFVVRRAGDINLLTGRKESSTSSVSFLREEKEPYGKTDKSQTLDKNTGELPFKNILRGRENTKSKEKYFKPANIEMSADYLANDLDPRLINSSNEEQGFKYGKTIVASASGSSSKVYIANILKEHMDILVPPKIFKRIYLDTGLLKKTLDKAGFDGEKAISFIEKEGGLIEAIKSEALRTEKNKAQRRELIRVADTIARGQFKKFLSNEVKSKHMTESHKDDFLSIMESPINNKVAFYAQAASHIARHRWWQTATIPNYLMPKDSKGSGKKDFGLGDSPMEYFDRLKIGGGRGIVIVGAGGTDTLLIDPEIGVGKNDPKRKYTWKFLKKNKETGRMEYQTISPTAFIAALGQDVYKGDGTLFRDSATYDKWAKVIGAEALRDDQTPLTSAKTVRRNKGLQGFSLDKSLSTIAPPGLKVTDKDGNVVLETRLSYGKVKMFGPNGRVINEFLTKDERKVSNKAMARDLEVTTTQEGSERIMWKHGKYAHGDVAFPVQLIDLLEGFPEGSREKEAAKILRKHGLNTVNEIMTDLSEMMKNPVKFRTVIDKMFKHNNEDLKSEARKLYEIYKDIPDHPALMSYFLPMIKNRYIVDGAYKLRSMGKKDSGGSYMELKWDIGEELIDSSHVMLSPNNQKMFNTVKEKFFNYAAKREGLDKKGILDEFNKQSKDRQLEILNNFLEINDISVLVSRHPVDSKSAVRMKRVQKFTGWWDSDSAYLDAQFVFGPFRADHDGDHINIEFLPDDITKEIKPYLSDEVAFEDDDVNLDWFENLFKDYKMTNPSQFFEVMSAVINSAGSAMGQAYNMRTVRGNLVEKDLKIDLDDGTQLVPIKPDEEVIMDYIYLDEAFNEDLLPKNVQPLGSDEVSDQRFERDFSNTPVFITTKPVGNTYKLVLYKDGKISPVEWAGDQRTSEELTAANRKKWKKKNNIPDNIPYIPFTSIAEESRSTVKEVPAGKKIIKLTSQHEMAILANAATDNPKKLRLYQMGFDGKPAFFISKYWWHIDANGNKHRINPTPDSNDNYGRDILNILTKVQKHFNHSKKRQGKDKDKEATIYDIWETAAKLDYHLNQQTSEEHADYIKKTIKLKSSMKIDKISMNNNKTVVEDILMQPYKKFNELNPEEAYPFSSTDPNNNNSASHFAPNAHYLAMESYINEIGGSLSKLGVSEKEKEIAENFLGKRYDPFYRFFELGEDANKERALNPSVRKVDYDEDIRKWHKEVLENDFKKIPTENLEGVKKYITFEFLSGRGGKKNIATLPSVDILDHSVLKTYAKHWKKQRKALVDGTAVDLSGKLIENPYQKEHKMKTSINRLLKGAKGKCK